MSARMGSQCTIGLHILVLDEMTHGGVIIQIFRIAISTHSLVEVMCEQNLSPSAGMSSAYYSYPDASDEECVQVIHRALELGINHLDTSDAYGPHTNERLVGEWPCISRFPLSHDDSQHHCQCA